MNFKPTHRGCRTRFAVGDTGTEPDARYVVPVPSAAVFQPEKVNAVRTRFPVLAEIKYGVLPVIKVAEAGAVPPVELVVL